MERVQCTVSGLRFVFGIEPTPGLCDQLARRSFGDQGDDPGVLIFGDTGLAPGTRTVA